MPPALRYVCRACGLVHATWTSRCHACGQHKVMANTTPAPPPLAPAVMPPKLSVVAGGLPPAGHDPSARPAPVRLSDVPPEEIPKDATGVPELDRVLGGGLARAGVYLLAGPPGCGKSSLVMQAISGARQRTLYASGEEPVGQVSARAHRIGAVVSHVSAVYEDRLEAILEHARAMHARIVVVDSIQAITTAAAPGLAGAPGQVTACAKALFGFAKHEDVVVIIIGHVNADDGIAGPRTLAHFVDVVVMLEPMGDAADLLRRLRCIGKNRFGAANIRGRMIMTDRGLATAPPPDEGEIEDEPDAAASATRGSDDPTLS